MLENIFPPSSRPTKQTHAVNLVSEICVLQEKPLNVITLGQTKTDHNNRMITINDDLSLVIYSKWDLEMWSHYTADNINSDNIKRLLLFYRLLDKYYHQLISRCNFEKLRVLWECVNKLYFVNKQVELFQNHQFWIKNQKVAKHWIWEM